MIGAAHAGWKGALGGVLEAAIDAMERLGAKRARIAAAIGPCISQANYEVGPEFRDPRSATPIRPMPDFSSVRTGPNHFRFDLEGYAAARLSAAGLADIGRLSACTYAREADFFSYRRTTHRRETDYGRQVSAIAPDGHRRELGPRGAAAQRAPQFTAPGSLARTAPEFTEPSNIRREQGGGRVHGQMRTWRRAE